MYRHPNKPLPRRQLAPIQPTNELVFSGPSLDLCLNSIVNLKDCEWLKHENLLCSNKSLESNA